MLNILKQLHVHFSICRSAVCSFHTSVRLISSPLNATMIKYLSLEMMQFLHQFYALYQVFCLVEHSAAIRFVDLDSVFDKGITIVYCVSCLLSS